VDEILFIIQDVDAQLLTKRDKTSTLFSHFMQRRLAASYGRFGIGTTFKNQADLSRWDP
jgi:hypothetical protein